MPESMLKGSIGPAAGRLRRRSSGPGRRGLSGTPGDPDGAAALQGARDAGMSIVFVTNNASREPHEVADHLTSLGIPTDPDEVLTAAQAVARLMAADLEPGATVLAVGGKGLRSALDRVRFHAGRSPTYFREGPPILGGPYAHFMFFIFAREFSAEQLLPWHEGV